MLAGYSLAGDGYVPQHIGGGALRLLDRLTDVPVCLRCGLDGDRMEQQLEFRDGLRAGARPRT